MIIENFVNCLNDFKCFYNKDFPDYSFSAIEESVTKNRSWIQADRRNNDFKLKIYACIPKVCRYRQYGRGCINDRVTSECASNFCELKGDDNHLIIFLHNDSYDNDISRYAKVKIELQSDMLHLKEENAKVLRLSALPIAAVGDRLTKKKANSNMKCYKFRIENLDHCGDDNISIKVHSVRSDSEDSLHDDILVLTDSESDMDYLAKKGHYLYSSLEVDING